VSENTAPQTPSPASSSPGMSVQTATRLEYAIIGLGMFALFLIFQPFSLALFGLGCGLVVLSGLINNLLPLCQPGVSVRSLVNGGLVVAGIFVAVLIIAIASAYGYGRFFVGP
jgi:hypothetical protein